MFTMSKLRLVLVDDHAVVRSGLQLLIDGQPDMEVVGQAGHSQEALDSISQFQPDVAVLDPSIAATDGSSLISQIARQCPQTKTLVLTAVEAASAVQQAFRGGAAGYVLKRSAATQVMDAIRTVATGVQYLDPALVPSVVGSFSAAKQPRTGAADQLSAREREVVVLTARGYSNKEIASQLDISVKTVETYKARSLHKLGLTSRAELVGLAMEKGWL